MDAIGWIIAAVLTALLGGLGLGWRLRSPGAAGEGDDHAPSPDAPTRPGPSDPTTPDPIPDEEAPDHESGMDSNNPAGDFLDEYYGSSDD